MTVVKALGIAAMILGIADTVVGAPIRNGYGNGWRWRTFTPTRALGSVDPTPAAPVSPALPPQIVSNADPDQWQGTGRYATLGAGPSAPERNAPEFSPTDRYFIPRANSIAPAPSPIQDAPGASVSERYDALVNLGVGPYSQASNLLNGTARPWYESPVVANLFGGLPDAAERQKFTEDVLRNVRGVFERSGIDVTLTTDPDAKASHTLSVVSNASYARNPDTIGVTDVGRDGFTLIDNFDEASRVDELSIAVGNNVAHELMHAFGVEEHPDETGRRLDAATASWSVLTDPNAKFSDEATSLILSKNFRFTPDDDSFVRHVGQDLAPAPVPEPATILVWSAAAFGLLRYRRRERSRPRA